MKCLVIHGSPRRGNTYDVLSMILEKIKDVKDLEVEIIELGKENLALCIGCFNCIIKGEDKCPHKSVTSKLIEKINEAEILIFTSPIYSMQISGLLKNFIDHLSYNFHRPKFIGKKALALTTTAGGGHKTGAKYIKSIFKYWGITNVEEIAVAYRADELSEKNKEYINKKACDFKNMIEGKKIKNASTKQVVMYNFWRGMKKEGVLFKDEEFYRENNRVYYDEGKVGLINKLIGNTVYKVIKKVRM